MESTGCIAWLKSALDELAIVYDPNIKLGEVVLSSGANQPKLQELKNKLEEKGYAIIYDRKNILAEQIKFLVFEMLSQKEAPVENYSLYISKNMHLNYTYLANIFSETQEITIEHFIINQKIQKVKQLLLSSEYSISQIADIMHYSSIGHLSNQFKKVTGVNPSEFKKQMQKASLT